LFYQDLMAGASFGFRFGVAIPRRAIVELPYELRFSGHGFPRVAGAFSFEPRSQQVEHADRVRK
jgi:hypothetical protein